MNWSQIQTIIDGQGIVFWMALAALVLGLTLLSVSIVFQVRKIVANSRFLNRKIPVATATENGCQTAGFVPAPEVEAVPAAMIDSRLDTLLARLKASADRLDRIHVSLGHPGAGSATTSDSLLQRLSEDIDYVYKTGRA